MRPVFEDVHQQFAVVAVGNFEEVAASVVEMTALLGMPDFGGSPVCLPGSEAQGGPAYVAARINTVAGSEDGVQLFVRNLASRCFENFRATQGIDGKRANGFAAMAPRIQISVFLVANQTLRGDFALAEGTQCAILVLD